MACLRAVALFVLAAFSSACSAKDFCAYPDANPLSWDKQFISRINRFFGGEKIEYFYSKHTTAAQVLSGLGGPPDRLVRLNDRLVLASACRHHSCIEKAAVVIACPDTLVAVGIFHYDHSPRLPADMRASNPHLTVYSIDDDEVAHEAIRSWAQAAAAGYGETLTIHHRNKSRAGLFEATGRE